MVETLLHFTALRSPQKQDSQLVIVQPDDSTPLLDELRRLNSTGSPPENIVQVLEDWLHSANVDNENNSAAHLLPFHNELISFNKALRHERSLSFSRLAELIQNTFGESLPELIRNKRFQELKNKLGEIIIALKNIPEYKPGLLAEYSNFYRLIYIIDRVGQNDQSIEGRKIKEILRSIIQIPEIYLLNRSPRTGDVKEVTLAIEEDNEEEDKETILKRIKELEKNIEEHEWAIKELGALGPYDFVVEVINPIPDNKPPADAARDVTIADTGRRKKGVDAEIDKGGDIDKRGGGDDTASHAAVSDIDVSRAQSVIVIAQPSVARLSNSTRNILQSLEIDPTTRPYYEMIDRIKANMSSLNRELSLLQSSDSIGTSDSITTLGSITIPTSHSRTRPHFGDIFDVAQLPTESLIKPAGIGDLLVVKQQIKRYEAGEISHIENILKSEERKRETRRLTRTEEIFEQEKETISEEERDLQSTERLNMRKEIENTVRQDERLKIGTSLSAGYAPYLQVGFNTEYETSNSKETASRMAHEYAKDVTERAASKLTERIRTQLTTKMLKEFEESNLHRFENTAEGSEHVVGIYQWVDRIYEEQVFNYGVRLFIDIMIPDPSLLYRRALEYISDRNRARTEKIEPPPSWDLTPKDIKEDNYFCLVQKFRASGVEPPPQEYVYITNSFEFNSKDPSKNNSKDASQNENFVKTTDLLIPAGYCAVSVEIAREKWREEGADTPFFIAVGKEVVDLYSTKVISKDKAEGGGKIYFDSITDIPSKPTGSISIGCMAFGYSLICVTLNIRCERTAQKLEEWQLKTYDLLLQAHQKWESEYRERIAEQEARQAVQIEGNNPLENRIIERNELKRSAISMISGQYFTAFNGAVRHDTTEIDIPLAMYQGRHVKFFEHAFEWDKIYYQFYPYYWGAKGTDPKGQIWADRATTTLRDNNDSQFTQFLNSSYCLVRIPVTPEFEEAVLHYLETKNIWSGGELPGVIGNERNRKLLEEIYARRGLEEEEEEEEEEHPKDVTSIKDVIPDKAIPVGDPWEVRLPTSLVKLRAPGFSASLPRWEKREENGVSVWMPVEP